MTRYSISLFDNWTPFRYESIKPFPLSEQDKNRKRDRNQPLVDNSTDTDRSMFYAMQLEKHDQIEPEVKIWLDGAMLKIFHATVDDYVKRTRAIWILSHTCHAWRDVVFGDISFWSKLNISWSEDEEDYWQPCGLQSVEAVKDALQKAPSPVPLDITVNLGNNLDSSVFSNHTQNHTVQHETFWAGDQITDADMVPWFCDAPKLKFLKLENVLEPEIKLDIAWNIIETYSEKCTRRIVNKGIPVTHLSSMTSLKMLLLDNTWLENGEHSITILPTVSTLLISYPRDPYYSHLHLPNYDRLSALALPNLQNLTLEGGNLGSQVFQDKCSTFCIASCIHNLLQRGGTSSLVSLTIALTPSLTDKSAILLLKTVPTLREFKVTQEWGDTLEQGILTPQFVASFCTNPFTLHTLPVQGANGFEGGKTEMVDFIAILQFQFQHSLQKLDLCGSRTIGGYCPFNAGHHKLLDLLATELGGDQLWIHRRGASHEKPAPWAPDPSVIAVSDEEDCYMPAKTNTDGKSDDLERSISQHY
ncbi:hypothetical protein B0H19DRAFT_1058951 [Mycena capillaripes]|nr:hypothetical protein B0H19DRAFT_1058951 [Mycena capillaripes]